MNLAILERYGVIPAKGGNPGAPVSKAALPSCFRRVTGDVLIL
jgi:hypothetical protein